VDGLNNPRGIAVTPGGLVLVAEAGTGRVLAIAGKTVRPVVRGLPTQTSPEGETTGVVNVAARLGRITVAIGGGPQNVDRRFDTIDRITAHHRTRIAADIQAYRNAHPDTTDLDQPPNPTDSNAYGLAALPKERFLVTDAAGNELDLIGSDGRIRTVAKFPNQVISTSHLPAGILPPTVTAVPAEAVPTSVAVGPDGWWYVGELKGFPFTPGASRVWRISPSARNVVCDPAATSGACTVFADGFTSITGLDFGPDGSLYVAEMVKAGVGNLFFNSGDLHGAVIKVHNGVRTELGAGQIVLAGDVAISRGGTVYVTDHSVIPGQGRVLAIR
jgi:DNA-binding beta-propeller fold protein YncE